MAKARLTPKEKKALRGKEGEAIEILRKALRGAMRRREQVTITLDPWNRVHGYGLHIVVSPNAGGRLYEVGGD